MGDTPSTPPTRIGRYAIFGAIARGGMASVHFGRLLGPAGFSRVVAIKRLHPHLATDNDFHAMFVDEARVAARLRHPNVVPVVDVVEDDGELLLVMDYIPGESLGRLLHITSESGMPPPPRVIAAIMAGVLYGLDAAHDAKSEHGEPLSIVHRDVSPQNILVGVDGVARVLDFGIAKASHRLSTTRETQLKGKLPYMAPEYVNGDGATQASDIYSAAVVLWEALTAQRLFHGESNGELLRRILTDPVSPPSRIDPRLAAFDEVVMRGLARDARDRFASAKEMAHALEACVGTASFTEVGTWVRELSQETLDKRAAALAEIERKAIPREGSDASTPVRPAAERTSPRSKTFIAWWALAGAVTAAATAFALRPTTRVMSPTRYSVAEAPTGVSTVIVRPITATGETTASVSAEPPPRKPIVKVNPPKPGHKTADKRNPTGILDTRD